MLYVRARKDRPWMNSQFFVHSSSCRMKVSDSRPSQPCIRVCVRRADSARGQHANKRQSYVRTNTFYTYFCKMLMEKKRFVCIHRINAHWLGGVIGVFPRLLIIIVSQRKASYDTIQSTCAHTEQTRSMLDTSITAVKRCRAINAQVLLSVVNQPWYVPVIYNAVWTANHV